MRRTKRLWTLLSPAILACVAVPASAQTNADSAWTAGDIALAERLYESEIGEGAASQRALHRLALIRAWSERYQESLELFDHLLVVAPTNVEASLDRAKVLSWRDDLEAAAAAYSTLLERDARNREARLGLARVLSWAGDLDAAEALYAEMLEADPRDAEALAGHARMAGWDGRLPTAEKRWRAALELHPDDVVLLTGLGATLRWRGRPGAAVESLERAVELDPDNEEVQKEYRLARLATAPRIGPSVTYESDSDGNRMATLHHDQSVWLGPAFAINTNGFLRNAHSTLTGESGEAYAGMIEARLRLGPGWELHTGGGASYNTLSGSGARPVWRVRAATPRLLPVQAWVRMTARPLDETAALMRNGIETRETSAGLRGAFLGFRGEASVGVTRFDGSERNERRAAVVSISRRLGTQWNLGVVARGFTFEKQLSDGYFDPDFYGLLEGTAAWGASMGSWHVQANASPGVQRVGEGGDLAGTIRTRLSFGHEFGPGQVVWLHTGYATTGLKSFSTDSDYRYFHSALSVGWAF